MRKWLFINNDIITKVKMLEEAPTDEDKDGIPYDTITEDLVDMFNEGDTYVLQHGDAHLRTPVTTQPVTGPIANIYTYGNIWVREIRYVQVGDKKDGHKHKFDHLHFIAKGKVKITIFSDRETILLEKVCIAPAWIKVPKEHFHDITALESDSLGYCLQALLSEDNSVVETSYIYDEDFMAEVKAYEESKGVIDEVAM